MTGNGPLAISIINYRTADMTIAAVESVRVALGDREARIVIVDNASGDGSAETLTAWVEATGDARLHLVLSPDNSGFSGGHNQGMAAAPGADFYLILNSDALLRPDFFDRLLPATDTAPEAGFFAPQLEWEDGTPQISCFRFASPTSELLRGARTGPVTRLFQNRVVALDLPPEPSEIEWASFACILLRGEMVRQIGPMDDGYFLYFEDAEYGLRAQRAGWGVRYVPAARVVHFRGGSGPVKKRAQERKRLPKYYWRSRTRFLRQAYGPLGPLRGNLSWVAGRIVARFRLLTGRGIPPSIDSEWKDIWTGVLAPLAPNKTAE